MIDPIDRQSTIKTAATYYCDRPALVDSITELLEKMPPVDPGVDEWCPDCKEYDSQRHMCPRFNRVIRDTLNEAKAAQNGVDGWIPCAERLPETEEYVLCTTETKKGLRQVVRGYYMHDVKDWACGMNRNVLAWQPLPTPWKETK